MTGTRSEWLRPISERYLEGDAGPAPATVKVAATFSALDAVAAAGLALVFLPMSLALVRDKPAGWGTSLVIAASTAAVAVTLFVTFGIGAWAIPARGWRRIPTVSGLVLAGMSAFSLVVVSLATIDFDTPATDGGDVAFLGMRAGTALVCSLALVFVLRLRSAGDWLAKRRHRAQTR
jgi:hypothetical protein